MDDDIRACLRQAGADLDSEPPPFRVRPGDQPLPREVPGAVSAHDMVVADLDDWGLPSALAGAVAAVVVRRKALGLSRYGQPLTILNGRDTARDALEEATDLCAYLRVLLAEGHALDLTYKRAVNVLVDLVVLTEQTRADAH